MDTQRRLVILTGMSGAGKSSALRMFEDLGYYCVDNLPPALIDNLLGLLAKGEDTPAGIAIVCDLRAGEFFSQLLSQIAMLRAGGQDPAILFLDCADKPLVARFEASRRHPPLGTKLRLLEAIRQERELLGPVREVATHLIDTSDLGVGQLRDRLLGIFVADADKQAGIKVTLLSFGFKHGLPLDADFVFDTRWLPNPFYDEQLGLLTGNDERVTEFVFAHPQAQAYLDSILAALRVSLDQFASVHKLYVVAALGCTGGKHRSVALVNKLADMLRESGYNCQVQHRDVER